MNSLLQFNTDIEALISQEVAKYCRHFTNAQNYARHWHIVLVQVTHARRVPRSLKTPTGTYDSSTFCQLPQQRKTESYFYAKSFLFLWQNIQGSCASSKVKSNYCLHTSYFRYVNLPGQPGGSQFCPVPSHSMFGKMEHQEKNCSPSLSFISNVHLNMIYYGKGC